MNEIIREIEQAQLKENITPFRVGDTIRVHGKIKEGNRERIQIFEGFVLKKQNGGIGETFTVRRIASGVGVEKTFSMIIVYIFSKYLSTISRYLLNSKILILFNYFVFSFKNINFCFIKIHFYDIIILRLRS